MRIAIASPSPPHKMARYTHSPLHNHTLCGGHTRAARSSSPAASPDRPLLLEGQARVSRRRQVYRCEGARACPAVLRAPSCSRRGGSCSCAWLRRCPGSWLEGRSGSCTTRSGPPSRGRSRKSCFAEEARNGHYLYFIGKHDSPPHLVRRARGLVEVAEEQNDWRCSSSLGIRVHLLQQLAHQR